MRFRFPWGAVPNVDSTLIAKAAERRSTTVSETIDRFLNRLPPGGL